MISRRAALQSLGLSVTGASLPGFARMLTPADGGLPAPGASAGRGKPADYTLEIAPASVELSARHRLRTLSYNGQVPGPLLRLKENRPVTIEVTNRSDRPEIVHWHGLFLPTAVDGAVEEGSPMLAPGATARYEFTPRPSGFRWYHTHTMAMDDLTRGQFSGLHGPMLVEPRNDPANFDQEFFIVLHDWEGHLLASDDGAMNPSYDIGTINGRMMGAGEPLRVQEGQRVLLHILNSSPTEVHWLSFAGHTLHVVALDGNPVPAPQDVSMVRIAPAERVCAIVQMNNPGVWVLGEVRRHVQAAGMAIAVEYANRSGAPQWQQPANLVWDYARFASPDTGANAGGGAAGEGNPPTTIPLVFESKFRGHGAMESWLINGKSYPDARVAPLQSGQRYRLQFINRSRDDHPLHLHRHSFELRHLAAPLEGGQPARQGIRGILKDVVLVEAGTRTEVDFTADNPGDTLFHCHQQNHMDLGFMMLFNYA